MVSFSGDQWVKSLMPPVEWWCIYASESSVIIVTDDFCCLFGANQLPQPMVIYWGCPAKRALSAMRKHGGYGPFGRIPLILYLRKKCCEILIEVLNVCKKFWDALDYGLSFSLFIFPQIYCCLGLLSILHRLHHVDADRLGWWLCERQLPSGGLNGK